MTPDEYKALVAKITAERDEYDREFELLKRTVEHEHAITLKIAERADILIRELNELRAKIGGLK